MTQQEHDKGMGWLAHEATKKQQGVKKHRSLVYLAAREEVFRVELYLVTQSYTLQFHYAVKPSPVVLLPAVTVLGDQNREMGRASFLLCLGACLLVN